MTDEDKATRLVVMSFPEDVVEELTVLSEFNAVNRTDFIVTSVELCLEELMKQYPHLAQLPPVPLRTRRRRKSYTAEDEAEEEEVLLAAEDDEEEEV